MEWSAAERGGEGGGIWAMAAPPPGRQMGPGGGASLWRAAAGLGPGAGALALAGLAPAGALGARRPAGGGLLAAGRADVLQPALEGADEVLEVVASHAERQRSERRESEHKIQRRRADSINGSGKKGNLMEKSQGLTREEEKKLPCMELLGSTKVDTGMLSIYILIYIYKFFR